MNVLTKGVKAKPFIKWVGGKGQLIGQLDAQLPADFDTLEDVTYVEPLLWTVEHIIELASMNRTAHRNIVCRNYKTN